MVVICGHNLGEKETWRDQMAKPRPPAQGDERATGGKLKVSGEKNKDQKTVYGCTQGVAVVHKHIYAKSV